MLRLVLVLIALASCAVVLACAAYIGRGWILANVPPRILYPVLGTIIGFRVERDVMIPMRDGTRLATDLYFPTRSSPPFPTVLIRTPYSKSAPPEFRFLRKGYAVAMQDIRGKFHSEGEFTPNRWDSVDGSDTVDWIARQAWSNHKVGTFGCSSLGEAQMLLARERNPRHAAMIAMSAGGAMGAVAGKRNFGVFEGGIFNLANGFAWFLYSGGKTPGERLDRPVDVAEALEGLPLLGMVRRFRNDPTDFDDFVSQPLDGPYWRTLGYIDDNDHFSTPALIINTWQDPTVGDTLIVADLTRRNWVGGASGVPQHVIIAPGEHCDLWGAAERGAVGDLPVGKEAAQPYEEWFVAWFDRWLRGQSGRMPDLPAYRFYVLGQDKWEDSTEWPPRGVQYTRWYLGGTSAANSRSGGGTLTRDAPPRGDRHDELRYDPDDPTPTRGGPIFPTGDPVYRSGPVDQRDVESRPDVLVYTSAPLREGLRIAGPLSAELHVSSTARDTDYVVKLVDVRPDGTALNIQEGALRMRYRDGYAHPKLMRPGEIYLARVDMRAIAYYFRPGHRLRLQVSSSNFPRLERNLNTGGNNYDETAGIVALNRIHTSPDRASAVIIPEWRQ